MTPRELILELHRNVCARPGCGSWKPAKTTFCGHCYHRLPRPMQHALYKLISNGYPEARETAIAWLTEFFSPGAAARVLAKEPGAAIMSPPFFIPGAKQNEAIGS